MGHTPSLKIPLRISELESLYNDAKFVYLPFEEFETTAKRAHGSLSRKLTAARGRARSGKPIVVTLNPHEVAYAQYMVSSRMDNNYSMASQPGVAANTRLQDAIQAKLIRAHEQFAAFRGQDCRGRAAAGGFGRAS